MSLNRSVVDYIFRQNKIISTAIDFCDKPGIDCFLTFNLLRSLYSSLNFQVQFLFQNPHVLGHFNVTFKCQYVTLIIIVKILLSTQCQSIVILVFNTYSDVRLKFNFHLNNLSIWIVIQVCFSRYSVFQNFLKIRGSTDSRLTSVDLFLF